MGGACSSSSKTTVVPATDSNIPDDEVVLPPTVPDPSDTETLRVEGVDLQVSQNVSYHSTDRYSIAEGPEPKLVVRRGQPFDVKVLLSRPFNEHSDDLRLVFETTKNPSQRKGTRVEFVLSATDRLGEWGARLLQKAGNAIDVRVFTPPGCMVAKWSFKLDVVKARVARLRSGHENLVYVLFNPWCREDSVYMESRAERDEYVMNDMGKIFVGSYTRITSKPWKFGQFSETVLDCAMLLLDESKLRAQDRGNPVHVARKLSALVNAPDDGGVLVGNWSGNYSGGASPLQWIGSVSILQQYYKERSPVRFGQCWVFSGLMTTLLRTLGIPARSVTNFASAHDVDGSVTIDKIVDENGKVLDETSDSVWNFHVWNEAWMTRSELPRGYGGWQACDATPQETSDGVYCCGPCPVRAIKEGEVQLAYDGPFIFAEVNADRVTWEKMKDGSYTRLKVQKTSVGKFISTRALNGSREDLTQTYKYPEGSAAERVAVRRAQQLSSSPYDHLEETSVQDVNFNLTFDPRKTLVGEPFLLTLGAFNSSSERRNVEGSVLVRTMFYTGVEADQVFYQKFQDVVMEAGRDITVEFLVKEEDYLGKLKDMCMLSFTVMARVKETGQVFFDNNQARLGKPHLEIARAEGTAAPVQVNTDFEVMVSFMNPLSCPLTKCSLDLETSDSSGTKTFKMSDLGPREKFSTTLTLKLTKTGQQEIIFMFNSKELEDINKEYQVLVI